MIYLAADHRGFLRKQEVAAWLKELKLDFTDLGPDQLSPDDDAIDRVKLAASRMGPEDRGIFFCGSGVMVDIVANRERNLRSCMAINPSQVESSRHDDDANVICIACDYQDANLTKEIVQAFLKTPFSGEQRYVVRLEKLQKG